MAKSFMLQLKIKLTYDWKGLLPQLCNCIVCVYHSLLYLRPLTVHLLFAAFLTIACLAMRHQLSFPTTNSLKDKRSRELSWLNLFVHSCAFVCVKVQIMGLYVLESGLEWSTNTAAFCISDGFTECVCVCGCLCLFVNVCLRVCQGLDNRLI